MMQHLKRIILILAGSALIGTLLLFLVFCVPVGRMYGNVVKSADEMIRDEEEGYANAFMEYVGSQRETYTDAIMVQNAVEKFEDKSAFECAMWVFHRDLDAQDWTPEESLKAYCDPENTEPFFLHEYSRYWHGYLIFLKPLLCLFTWKHALWLVIGIQIALLIATVWMAVKCKQPGVAIALGAGFLFMKPVIVIASFTMSVCVILTLLAMLIVMQYHERLKERCWYPEFFLLIGILTSYFDFLTYPIVTLGFPLCTVLLIERSDKWKKTVGSVIGYSACWGIGYAGMWAMKWVIADITLKTGTINNAIWSIIGRTEAIGGRERMDGGWYVVLMNLKEYSAVFAIVAAILAVAVIAAAAVVCTKGRAKEMFARLLPYGAIMCMPFAWIIVVQHHSAVHARFTFRIISVAVMALTCIGWEAYRIWRDSATSK